MAPVHSEVMDEDDDGWERRGLELPGLVPYSHPPLVGGAERRWRSQIGNKNHVKSN